MAENFGGKIFWRIAEIMTFGGIYFGSWESLSHNDIHCKMANWTNAGNLTGPWASFDRSYHSDAETENRLPIFFGKWPTTTSASVFTVTTYTLFGLRWQANSFPTSGVQNPSETWYPRMQLSMVNSLPTITLACSAAGLLYTWKLWLRIMMTAHCKVLANEILPDCSQNRQSANINFPPKFPAIRY